LPGEKLPLKGDAVCRQAMSANSVDAISPFPRYFRLIDCPADRLFETILASIALS
jgi:hypothetical protein